MVAVGTRISPRPPGATGGSAPGSHRTPVAWSPCRPRTIQLPVTASPCSRLSRPQSSLSQSDFHPVIRPFSPLRLGSSYRLAPEPDGSPLFALLPLVACWRYEPREHLRPLAIARAAIPPSPLRDRVGYSDHDRFRDYVSVHCRSGFPVYPSQRLLPDATQDSVRGCLLGFAAAAISDGRLQRACKAQPAQIPACAAHAPGSSLGSDVVR
jgi:hypothetical protein